MKSKWGEIFDLLMDQEYFDLILHLIRSQQITVDQYKYHRGERILSYHLESYLLKLSSISDVPTLVKASDCGHVEMVRHLLKMPSMTDEDGPDGLNALELAIGHLDHNLVKILANPEVKRKESVFLCDIISEIEHAITNENSTSKIRRYRDLMSTLMDSNIHDKLCKKLMCKKSGTSATDSG